MKKSKLILPIATLICLILGFLLGFLLPDFSTKINFIGEWYIKILKIIIGPVIFVSIFSCILKRKKSGAFLVGKTVLLFVLMFVSTFMLTSLIVTIFQPGVGFKVDEHSNPINNADFGFVSILKNLLPSSFEDFFMGKNLFLVIVVALVLSFIISKTPIKEKTAIVFDWIKKWLNFLLQVVIYLTPIAIISLVSNSIVTYGEIIIANGLIYIGFAWGISLVALFLVMILPAWLIAKINPFVYIKKVAKVWVVSLSTCSSLATLPHTIKVCNEDFGVDEKITNIVVPLGCTIHMCGGAVSFALLGLFVSQLSGFSLSLGTFLLMILFATLINMAAPGIPGGGVVIGFSYLSILNLPITGFYGLYAGIYKFLDMAYTTLNVTGDVSANILLNHFESKKNGGFENGKE